MAEQTGPILCGVCRVQANVIIKSDGSKEVACPTCGQREEFEAAIGQALKYHVGEKLGDAFRGIGSGGSFTVKSAPNPRPRFIMGDTHR